MRTNAAPNVVSAINPHSCLNQQPQYRAVVIYCKRFGVVFSTAELAVSQN
jgi:hypothetical protein